jgi:cobalt-zinc-cadmium efflux system outer membrane protein
VREALTQYQKAMESLQQYRTRILPQVAEGVRLAETGYKSGDQSYLFVLEATRRLLDARLREIELVHELRRASAQLDRSIGRKRDAKS